MLSSARLKLFYFSCVCEEMPEKEKETVNDSSMK